MRAVTIAVAILAILVSALAMSPDINQRVLFSHPAVASMSDTDVADHGSTLPAPDTKCHVGHSCTLVIMPSSEILLASFDSAPDFSPVTGYHSSISGYLPFHPPRILSQI